jgi:hypothetical protein
MAPHNIADEPTVHSISTTTTAGESNHAMMCCSAVRAVSSLAVWLSVVPFRWTTTPTSSHCALGRAVGKRLYAYTLVQTYPSHTTASTCLTLAATHTRSHVARVCVSWPGEESQLASKAARL